LLYIVLKSQTKFDNKFRFFKPTYHNDIGLIRVSKSIQFNSKVKAIELSKTEIPENSTLILTGFGKLSANKTVASEKLQTIELKMMNNEKCRKAYSKYESEAGVVGAGHLCTFNGKGQGACGELEMMHEMSWK
jgi:trypsin